jgi:glycosyltransferase involved in cell wall biosynthesis
MKIGIEAQRLFRSNKHGMEIVALEVIKQLQQIDNSNEYVVFAKEGEDMDCISETSNFDIETVKGFSYPDWEQISLPKAANEHDIDLLHCTANTAPLFCNKPLVITLHDIIYLENISFSGSAYQNFGNLYRRWVVPEVIQKCNAIITVSEYEKNKIVEALQLPEEKIHVVYNAANKVFRVYDDQELLNNIRATYKLPKDFILFFGNTAPKKNTAGVLQAYAQLCKTTANPMPLVITDCKAEYIARLLKDVDAEHLMEHIILPGYVPFDDMPYLYNLATLFLYPSLRESFGMPILESMQCGTPVITSTTSAMPEVAGPNAMMIDPYAPDELALAIDRILSDSELYQQKVNYGFEQAAKFSWKNAARQVLNTYHHALN